MKIHILFGMIGFILVSGCNRAPEKNPRFYDAGVSRELAGHRKAQIKNLKYELSFNIPRQKEAAIEGDITLRFDLASRQVTNISTQTRSRVSPHRFALW